MPGTLSVFHSSDVAGLNPWRTMDGTLPRSYSSPKMAVTSPWLKARVNKNS
jgi:hypothetical protein